MDFRHKKSGATVEAIQFWDNNHCLCELSSLMRVPFIMSYENRNLPTLKFKTVKELRVAKEGDYIVKDAYGLLEIYSTEQFLQLFEKV